MGLNSRGGFKTGETAIVINLGGGRGGRGGALAFPLSPVFTGLPDLVLRVDSLGSAICTSGHSPSPSAPSREAMSAGGDEEDAGGGEGVVCNVDVERTGLVAFEDAPLLLSPSLLPLPIVLVGLLLATSTLDLGSDTPCLES